MGRAHLHQYLLLGLAAATVTSSARAQSPAASDHGVSLRASAATAHALTSPQTTEFGWGAFGSGQLSYRLHPLVSPYLSVDGLWLAEGKSPGENLAKHGAGRALIVQLGLTLHPLASSSSAAKGLWLSAGGGYVRTGSWNRPAVAVDLGQDFDLGSGRFAAGPWVGVRHIFQPNSELQGDDANIGMAGIQGRWDLGPRAPQDLDWDKDGILNDVDKCPREPEDRDGFQDSDGCPDPDNDKDRILDPVDKCPNEPEDYDNFEDSDGCPDPDNDKDRILDPVDKCPNEPEDRDGFQDSDGCPDPDNDKDGFLDPVDKCPNEPETVNGYADDDGCPDQISVRVTGTKIVLDERIYFAWNRAEIQQKSVPLMQRMATLLREHPEYMQISIEGHADEVGTEQYNQQLSESRAKSVREMLVSFGVDGPRLITIGYGESRPAAKGHSSAALSLNRRVEFVIVQRKEIDGESSQNLAHSGQQPESEPTKTAPSGTSPSTNPRSPGARP